LTERQKKKLLDIKMAVWAEQSAADNYSTQLAEEVFFKFLIEYYFVPDEFDFFIGEF